MSRCEEIREAWSAAIAAGKPIAPEVEAHLAECADCSHAVVEMERLWQRLEVLSETAPSDVLRRDFEAMLAGHRDRRETERTLAAERGRVSAFRPRSRRIVRRRLYELGYGLAALLAGVVIGVYGRRGDDRTEMAEMRGEVRALREQVTLSMLQQTSASARLEGVSMGAQMARRDPEVMRALMETLTTDPSPNVRLAAVEALAARAGDPGVQTQLGQAIAVEESPLVQIALTDALLAADREGARRILAPLAKRSDVNREVRKYIEQRLGARI